MRGIATAIGACGSAASIMAQYNYYGTSEPIGERLTYALLGYNAKSGGSNAPSIVFMRLMRSYGPLLGGVVVSKASSRLGVNRSLPKGINL